MIVLLFETAKDEILPVTRLADREPGGDRQPKGRIRRIQEKIHNSYWRLASRLPYPELFCTQLRHASEIQVLHSSQMGPERARERFRGFLRAQQRKHGLWFCIDGFLALGGVFLTPVPGPNLFFFYPAARCWGHYLARRGAQKALASGKVSFSEEPLIDRVQGHLEDASETCRELEPIRARYNLNAIDRVVSILSSTDG